MRHARITAHRDCLPAVSHAVRPPADQRAPPDAIRGVGRALYPARSASRPGLPLLTPNPYRQLTPARSPLGRGVPSDIAGACTEPLSERNSLADR